MAGLRELGVSPHHRRTFQRIRGILEGDQLSFELGDEVADESRFGDEEVVVETEVAVS